MKKGTLTLKTKRLTLRRFNENDLDFFFSNWASSSKVTKYLTWPSHQSKDITKKVLDSFIASYKDKSYNWAIVVNSINEPIGNISVVDDRYDIKQAEIGYCIGDKYWNNGYVSEALKEVISYLFKEGYQTIIGKHDINNPASGKVMVKAGMKFSHQELGMNKNNTGLCDCDVYFISSKDK